MKRLTLISYILAILLICNSKISNAADHCFLDTQRCFILVADPTLEWGSAEEYCENQFYRGFLASIRNAFEKSIIQGIISDSRPSTDVWIGGFRTGGSAFQWADGEPFVYNQFAPGQPDPSGSCIQVCSRDESGCRSGQWKAAPCVGVRSGFLCEYMNSPSTAPGSTMPPPPWYPCKRDILILMDSSSGLQSMDNFLNQIMFISQTLITQWTVSPSQVEANPAVYTGNSHDFNEFGSFGYESTDELRRAIVSALNFFSPHDPPSIKVGLQEATIKVDVTGWRDGVTRSTLLFTSSSDPLDVTAALPYAAQLKSNGSSLIVIGMGPFVNAAILAPIASGPNFLFTVPFYNMFLNNTALADQINAAICLSPPSTTPGPTTTPPTTTIATTTTLPPSFPCRADVLMLVDVSAGLRSQTNFDDQILFITAALISSGWTVSTLQIEANPVSYEKSNFVVQGSFGHKSATELKEGLESIFWLGDTPSIAYGLQELVGDDNLGWRAGVPRIVLLFTSTSDQADVTQALPFANLLKSSNHMIIVVGLGPSVSQNILVPLASGANNVFISDFAGLSTNDALAAQLNAAICRYNPPPQPSTTIIHNIDFLNLTGTI